MKRPGPWVALDTGFFDDERVEELSDRATLLYISSLCHCMENLTDGLISKAACGKLMGRLRARPSHVQELVQIQLWIGDGPWTIPAYGLWQKTRADFERERAQTAHRQREWRERQSQSNAGSNGVRNALREPSRTANVPKSRSKDLYSEAIGVRGGGAGGGDTTEPARTLDDMPGRPDTMPALDDVLRSL